MESLRVPVKSCGRCVRRDFSVVREKRSLRDAQTRFSESVKGEWLCFGFWFCTQVWCTPRVFKSGERALFRCQLLDFPGLQSQILPLSKEKEKKRKERNANLSTLPSHLWSQGGEAGGWVMKWQEAKGQPCLPSDGICMKTMYTKDCRLLRKH